MEVKVTDGFLDRGPLQLYWQAMLPGGGQPRATVAVVHGLGEHLGRHLALARFLASEGYAVVLSDLRGAGRSGGRRGHVDRFSDYMGDLKALLDVATSRDGLPEVGPLPAPVVVYGQSMGGLLALAFALAYPGSVKGVIAASPALGQRLKLPFWKEALAWLLAGLAPGLRLPTGLPLENLAHDPQVAAEYRADPLCFDRGSARWYQELKRTRAEVLAQAATVRRPVLLIQGGADRIVDPELTEAFYARLSTAGSRFLRYEEAFHEVFREACGDAARREVAAWLGALDNTEVMG
jgi:lysophospholipase